ncbi:MAG TPA: ATP-binding cassette domain-containing protein [Fimbriimonadaceae bacterium]|nr:ATP-binding cassette domain-containing protein [Fimbriimonadaceae bacterium]
MISVRHVSQSFGDKAVLRDIDLEVARGEIVAIMGSSGGGKTTLLRCIAGLLRPSRGEVEVDGIDVLSRPEEARRHMGMVFQSGAPFDYLSVADNVLFGARRHLKLTREQERELLRKELATVGLEGAERLFPSELSGGMRKRLGIARALAISPSVMLYDEPTTGLDPITTYTIDALIVRLRKEVGVTTLLVSHDVSSVFRVADRIAFLHEGELVFQGSPGEFEKSGNEAIREMVGKAQATAF